MNQPFEKNKAIDQLRCSSNSKVPFGIFIASTDPTTSEIAAHSGFDFCLIDGEHGPLDRLTVLGHIRAAESFGMVPLVRGLDSSNTLIQSMLDLGAAGVVIPRLETAEDASRVVAASRYAPEGLRGMCPSCHDGRYTLKGFTKHMKRRNKEAMVIPIIETVKAVENIKDIVAVEGIDIIHYGPGDLSADMGINIETEIHLLQETWIKVRDAAHEAGKYVLVPDGFGFEGGDAYIAPMELLILHDTLSNVVEKFQSSLT